jgi:cytochrome c553
MNKLFLAVCFLMVGLSGPALAGDADAGKKKSQTCVACHGPDGNRIAGQHYDYLLKALKDYKSGARKSPIMAPLVANLSQRDVEDLAAYYSSQRGLVTKY